jgi:hypothetical protein
VSVQATKVRRVSTNKLEADNKGALRCEVPAMRKVLPIYVTALVLLLASSLRMDAQEKEALRPLQTIPLPNVKGRIDHMDVDVKGKRLFVAGLENGSGGSPGWQMDEKHSRF